MPRPRKCRRVCALPETVSFGPVGACPSEQEPLIMSVEEFETIRLIDHMGMDQAECAQRMSIARTTVQRIYNDARYKLAEFLVSGRPLTIGGGDFKLCEHRCAGCARGQCRCREAEGAPEE